MSRAEFLRLLRWRLAQMPQSEIEKNVAYYDEMFSDMIEDGMTEEEAAARLGDPEEIAKELLRDMPMSELVRSRVRPSGGWTAFSILLAVVLCPIWLPLLIAAAAVVLGLFIALWAVALAVLAVVAALVIGAVTLVGAAIFGYLSVPWGLLTGMALIALGAALLWAIYSILIKPYTEQYDSFLVTRRVFFWAFITAIPLMLMTDGMPNLTPLFTQPKVLLSWIFLAVFGNAICFAIWNIAFQRLGVVITNNYLYASPFVTLIVGWLLLGEPVSLMSIIGAVLITVGVICALKKTEK